MSAELEISRATEWRRLLSDFRYTIALVTIGAIAGGLLDGLVGAGGVGISAGFVGFAIDIGRWSDARPNAWRE
jgi:hypothetical protein